MKRFLSIIMVFLLSISIFGCSCSKEDLLIYRNFYDKDISTFNYMISNEYQEMIRIANLVDGLVENDKYGNIVPSIAKSWKSEIVDGKQIWTFYLKDNVYWSNYKGEKYALVTANDFVTSLKYVLNYNSGSKGYGIASYLIDNGENYYNGTLIENFNYDQVLSQIDKLKISDPHNQLSYYENIKSIFQLCSSSECTTDFEKVGVKAIDNFTLQYTLSKPVPYFLSTLTYYTFLPANEGFITSVGFNNFGTTKEKLLYNGAYILENYYHSSRIEYIKNDNYWDKENVYIDKLIFTKSLNYHSLGYSRLSYEAGNLSEFSLSENDATGWKKYVTGYNNEGSMSSPVGDNTYTSDEITTFVSYYLIFNQERKDYNYTSMIENDFVLANLAMKNDNFRKALMFGLETASYFENEFNISLSSIVPKGFISYEDKDYSDFLVETYADKNNMGISEADNILNADPFFNVEKSNYYLNLALEELNVDDKSLPIKLEYTYYYDDTHSEYDKQLISTWNKLLNGCDMTYTLCSFDKIEIVYNDTVDSIYDYNIAFNQKEYNLTLIGLYPDFNDPTAYLNAFATNGELVPFINHSTTEIDNMINEIDSYYLQEDLSVRYKLCSELEYYLIFEKSLLLPLSLKGNSNQIVVSNIYPYEKMKATYGLSPFKFKYRRLTSEKLTQEDIRILKEQYELGRVKYD